MASPEILDFETLLAPISDDNPVGEDPRKDSSPNSLYYAVKDARSTARSAERQAAMGEEGEEHESPNWRPVIDKGKELLIEVGKDLEPVAYMIEALVRVHGFAGLRDGFHLARRLVEEFWESLYPLPDEDGMETRVAPLTGLNGDDAEGTLIGPISKVMLTEGDSAGPYAQYHYQQAGSVAQIIDQEAKERRIEQGAVSLEMFERAVRETPSEFYANLVEDIQQTQEEYSKLCEILDEKCGTDAPPASNIRSALESCLDTVRSVARDKLAVAEEETEEEAEEGDLGSESGEKTAKPKREGVNVADIIRNRDEAFRTLAKVADYFRQAEPHTPVSYALDQIVRWGRMSLPDLLAELISDEAARTEIFTRVGIRPSQDEED